MDDYSRKADAAEFVSAVIALAAKEIQISLRG